MSGELICGMPIQGGCPNAAREAVLAHPSIDVSGPMAQWAVHLRCGTEHTAETAGKAIMKADPGATVLVFSVSGDLEPGIYGALFKRRIG